MFGRNIASRTREAIHGHAACRGVGAALALRGRDAGFTDASYRAGLTNPTAMEFAPDGRLFVEEQGGDLRIIDAAATRSRGRSCRSTSTPRERGLLEIAFDPAFLSNGFVYLY